MSRVQWLAGVSLLGSVLAFGLYGIAVNAQEGRQPPYVKNEVYIEECGACHLAYPPGLAPVATWQAMMDGLADHFGENAEVDEETETQIRQYLIEYALGKGDPSTMSQLARNMPAEPPIRITEFPAFVTAHETVAQQLDLTQWPAGFLSPCADCHRQAADARFEKELLHPGYGPSWGNERD